MIASYFLIMTFVPCIVRHMMHVYRHVTKIGLPHHTYLALIIRQLAQSKIEMKIQRNRLGAGVKHGLDQTFVFIV